MSEFHDVFQADYVRKTHEALDLATRLAQAEEERDEARENWKSQISWASELEKENNALLAEGVLLREALERLRDETADAGEPGWPNIAGFALESSPLIAAEVERVKKLEVAAEALRGMLAYYTGGPINNSAQNAARAALAALDAKGGGDA